MFKDNLAAIMLAAAALGLAACLAPGLEGQGDAAEVAAVGGGERPGLQGGGFVCWPAF